MRIKLSESNMDIVMHTVRTKGINLVDAVNYLLDHPEEIESTRGTNEKQKTCGETCKG
ncbi:hypothetical protein VPH166E361_0032 [Vibrio phage 166E36-1]